MTRLISMLLLLLRLLLYCFVARMPSFPSLVIANLIWLLL